jgi:hypothetical protein
MAYSKSDAVACPRGTAQPHFTTIHKPLEPFEFREPYQIRRVQSSGDNWAIRRRMSRLCRFVVRIPNEKSLLPIGLIANKFGQRMHAFSQAGGAREIRTRGTASHSTSARRSPSPPKMPLQMPSRVATRWRFLKSKKPPQRAAFRFNADLSASYFGCGDRI